MERTYPRYLEIHHYHCFSVTNSDLQVEGQTWQRQRKITASCFNEGNNDLVWTESIRQARAMLEYWCSKPSVISLADDVRTLSLHVLSSAGFGKPFAFQGHEESNESSQEATSYKESLQIILDNCILLMVLGKGLLGHKWLPQKLQKLHQATSSFERYMVESYEKEKRSFAEEKPAARNLMTTLVRSSIADKEGGLTEKEIYGNLFVFNFAGHDTTCHIFAFAITLLAAHPDVQEWLSEEIRRELLDPDPKNWNYQKSFPRLTRCLAVLVCLQDNNNCEYKLTK